MKNIRFGQIWRFIKDYEILEKWSPQINCSIPAGQRIIILNTPPLNATHVYIMPMTTQGLSERLIPNVIKLNDSKEGFGIGMDMAKMQECCILDDDQSVKFDSQELKEFWNIIKAHNS